MIIDLHGMIEYEAISAVLVALTSFEDSGHDELEIITGNGQVLRDVAIELIEDEGFQWRTEGNNYGSIIVVK